MVRSNALLLASLLAALTCTAPARADGAPPIVVSPSHFITFAAQPWLTVCEWKDAAGASRNSWTEGLTKPDDTVVPTDALCTKVKRYNFAGGGGLPRRSDGRPL